jgi:putative NADH-flavin reductase
MNILLIGASRGIGYELLQQLLSAGHHVTAILRNPLHLQISNDNLKVIQGDILDKRSVEEGVEGQEAVCITIGINPTFKTVEVFSRGTGLVIDAMKKFSCRRLICVTGIGAGDSRNHGGFFYDRIINPLLLKNLYADKDRQEAIIRNSGLEWVIVRPGFLTNGPFTGQYRVLNDLRGIKAKKISRADVADFIVQELEHLNHKGQTPLITY